MKQEFIAKLSQHQVLTDEECFDLICEISRLINSPQTVDKSSGRSLIIYALDNWENFSNKNQEILTDLISAAGFYPYIQKNHLNIKDFSEEIRLAYHKSTNLENCYFHPYQKRIDTLIKNHTNVIVSAPTSFGKSMLIEEIVASNEYHNIVIIQPTLALLDETRRKLKKYADHYKIIVKTTQSVSENSGNIFLLTAERVLEFPDMPPIELLVLDEFYKLSNRQGDNRNNVLNTAFIRIMKNPECKFYLLGPNIEGISKGFAEKYDAVFVKTDFSLVLTEEVNKFDQVHIKRGGKVEENDVYQILDDLDDQTLIYCSSPKSARKLAFGYCEHLIANGHLPTSNLPLVDWIHDNLSYRWSLAKCLQHGISVHDGSMPKHITASTIEYFNQEKIKFLFCTNTIIEGVNTSAKNVIYCDNRIGPNKIDYFDYSNIKGRAGRLMEHYVGRIINLREPPKKKDTYVEFPFFEQNPIASEVLVNLDDHEVKDINDNLKRYADFRAKDIELQEILKRNAVSIEGQEAILKQLFIDLASDSKKDLIIWNQIDGQLYARLNYIFDLCWENLSTIEERKSFGSKGWVVNKVVSSCYRTPINSIINNDVEFRAKALAKTKELDYISVDQMFKLYPNDMQAAVDLAIERVFSLQKNWLQYRAPKWINVVDSLQKYATKKLSLSSGDYSYVAEMIENSFIHSSLRILLEYGVPISAIEKLQFIFSFLRIDVNKLTEDEIPGLINAHQEEIKHYLSPYEMEIIKRVL